MTNKDKPDKTNRKLNLKLEIQSIKLNVHSTVVLLKLTQNQLGSIRGEGKLFNFLSLVSSTSFALHKTSIMNKAQRHFLTLIGVWNIGISSRTCKFIFFVNITIVLTICCTTYYLQDIAFLDDSHTSIERLSDVAAFLLPLVTHFVILIETFIKRKKIEKTWAKIQNLIKASKSQKQQSFGMCHLVLCTALEGFLAGSCVYFRTNWGYHWLVTECSFFICHVGSCCYAFYINLLFNCFDAINKELILFFNASKFNKNNVLTKNFHFKLLKLFGLVSKCHRIHLKINDVFAWSLLFNNIHYFITLALNIFFFQVHSAVLLKKWSSWFICKFCSYKNVN